LTASPSEVPPIEKDQQHRQRRAGVREDERVDGGRDVVASDCGGMGDEAAEPQRRIGAA
jgi:hypothetical protein